MSRFPARLHVLLASSAPVGLVLRRGPSRAVCSIGWDREHDTFAIGQWLRGRIYERRCDISPDGRHWIYFASNQHSASDTRGSWTAVARTPWLKAIVLFGKGDCWQGGGLFTSDRRYWVNGGGCHFPLRDSRDLDRDCEFRPAHTGSGECPGVYYPRLQRDGWIMGTRLGYRLDDCVAFEKPLRDGWVLRKLAHEQVGAPPGKGCYWDEHEVEHAGRGIRIACPHWEWAEVDRETLVWAERGALHRGRLDDTGIVDTRVVADFDNMAFERRVAPYD